MAMDPCGPVGLRERKKLQTREAIVDAALELFERKGFEATTVEDIAAAADVSPRTFFRYFESKQDVVMAKTNDKGDDLGTLLTARPPEEPPLEALRRTILGVISEMVATDDGSLREMRVMMGTPELRAMALDHFHDHQDELAVALAGRMGLAPDAFTRPPAGRGGQHRLCRLCRPLGRRGRRPEHRMVPMIDEVFDMLASGFESVGIARRPARRYRPAPCPCGSGSSGRV